MNDHKTGNELGKKRGFGKLLRRLGKDQRGLSTVEYIIILVLIAIAAISVWSEFGGAIREKVQGSTDKINDLSLGGN